MAIQNISEEGLVELDNFDEKTLEGGFIGEGVHILPMPLPRPLPVFPRPFPKPFPMPYPISPVNVLEAL